MDVGDKPFLSFCEDLKPFKLKGGGSKANFFGVPDLSFGHHRCP